LIIVGNLFAFAPHSRGVPIGNVQRVIRLASQRMNGAATTTTGNIAIHE